MLLTLERHDCGWCYVVGYKVVVVDCCLRLDLVVVIILGWRSLLLFCSVDCIGEAKQKSEMEGEGSGGYKVRRTGRMDGHRWMDLAGPLPGRDSLCVTTISVRRQPSNQARSESKQASMRPPSPAEHPPARPVNQAEQATNNNKEPGARSQEQGRNLNLTVTITDGTVPSSPLFYIFPASSPYSHWSYHKLSL